MAGYNSLTLCCLLHVPWILQSAYATQARDVNILDHCNQTLAAPSESKMSLSLASIAEQTDKPLYCWFRFNALEHQIVEVDVKSVRAGRFDDNTKVCEQGYLRISDKEVCSTDPGWLPPTTLCGSYNQGEVRVKRYTQGPSAFVEFKVDQPKDAGGYDFDVEFLDRGYPPEKLPYGDTSRKDGLIENTKCDWLIPVDECLGYCRATSPLYPGIYPPNTRCRYLFTNFNDGRVELMFGGNRFSGKFDLKRDPTCSEDFIEVYDGTSTVHPLIGRWCGQDGTHLISASSSLLLIFQTGPGGPPWDYSGFDITYTERWKHEHEGAEKVEDTLCDWEFHSAMMSPMQRDDGSFHTPDHVLGNNTRCSFKFKGRYNELVQIEVGVYDTDDDNCQEHFEIYDGDQQLGRVCPSPRRRSTKRRISFDSTGPEASVVFVRDGPQQSKPDPNWVYYKFVINPEVTGPPPKLETRENKDEDGYQNVGKPAGVISKDGGTNSATSHKSVTSLLFVITLLTSIIMKFAEG